MPGDDVEQRARARVGRILDEKYSLERLLGYGGMAAVYEARHRNGHRCAVKILHPEIARDEVVRGRFLSEGYAANKVEHPGAVEVTDDDVVQSGEDKNTAYLVMELLDGESVFSRAKRGQLTEAEVLTIAEGVLDVLDAAHARGIIHRDLKPDNLFLVRDGDRERVKVLDFGIARIADAARKTNVGQTLGTPSYMSPEQARGDQNAIDGRTDLFSLGATMFRLLSGRRIHEADNPTEILAKMATLPAPPVHSIAPHISAPVAAIIDRALQFRRENRYPSAAEMRNDVRAAREGRPLPSPDFAPIGFSPGAEPTAAPPPQYREQPTVVAGPPTLPPTASHSAPLPPVAATPITPRPRKKSGAVIFAIVSIVVLAGALVAAFVIIPTGEPKRTPAPADEEIEPAKKAKDDKSDPKPAAKSVEKPDELRPDDPSPPPTPAKSPTKIAPKTTAAATSKASTSASAPAKAPVVPKLAPIPSK